jgi:hypothetical protein
LHASIKHDRAMVSWFLMPTSHQPSQQAVSSSRSRASLNELEFLPEKISDGHPFG